MTPPTGHEPNATGYEAAATGRAPLSTASRGLALLLVVFAVLVVFRSLSEGIHDIALAGVGTLTAALLGRTQWLLAAGLVLFGLGFTAYLRSAGLLVQLRAPAALLGTWHGLLDAVVRIAGAGAILATGFLFDRFGGKPVHVTLGVLLLLTAALWSTFGPQDRHALGTTPLHPAPTPTAAE
ncbi:hypothetical protein [Streptomyces sp. NPDC058623]|uniref:hypothetical protein n=1 Tax=Streptomyces sp. NPDC058623 TaxID=3346563 RepID=UPI00364A274F